MHQQINTNCYFIMPVQATCNSLSKQSDESHLEMKKKENLEKDRFKVQPLLSKM